MSRWPARLVPLVPLVLVAGCAPVAGDGVVRARPAIAAPAPTHALGASGPYRPPVDAPVVDPFRPPPGPFGAGNRGLEYATRPGTAVVAIGAGRVVFAGPVAGSLHVTVRHDDGLRSSYSYLATVAVGAGDLLAARQVVGTATTRLHLGVRAADAYLDPARLFERGAVRLVPEDVGGGPPGR